MKKILFLTGTRADFGKIKPLIRTVEQNEMFNVDIFVTGMHMMKKYGATHLEVDRCFKNTIHFINQRTEDAMDEVLANTVKGLGDYVSNNSVDLIVVHGDRVEALAGAIVGCLHNIMVSHIEGGELSGTVDEMLRHSISKLSHTHFVANQEAKTRLIQMGESPSSIYPIGSPDLDVMNSNELPDIVDVSKRYDFASNNFGIIMFHPVTTSIESIEPDCNSIMEFATATDFNWIVIMPNNDHGTERIEAVYRNYEAHSKFRFIKSMRFEYFLVALKNAKVMIGNSSAGVREAPFYGVPSVDVGTRQAGRGRARSIFHTTDLKRDENKIHKHIKMNFQQDLSYGDGSSSTLFENVIKSNSFWETSIQKTFYSKDV